MARIAPEARDPERGKRLDAALRTRRVRKMYALASEVGVNESAISRWRKGEPITTHNVIKLCEALDISADWLLLGRGNIDQHGGFSVTNEEKALLRHIRRFPPEFLNHLTGAIESITAQ